MADRIRNCFNKIEFVHMKGHYFFFNAALACVIPFLPVYAKQLGISAISVGLIFTIMPLLSTIAKPLVGGIADRTKKIKTILHFFICIICISSLSVVFIPKKDIGLSSRMSCAPEGSLFFYERKPSADCHSLTITNTNYLCLLQCNECTLATNGSSFDNFSTPLNCEISEDETPSEMKLFYTGSNESDLPLFNVTKYLLGERNMNVFCLSKLYFSCHTTCAPEIHDCFRQHKELDYTSQQIWVFSLMAVLISVSSGIIVSLSDTACFTALGDRPHLYGRQRLWGTMGWGIFAAVAGALNDLVTGESFVHAYYPGFSIVVILLVIDIFTIRSFCTSNMKHSSSILKDIGQLMSKPNILMFLSSVFVVGFLTGIFWYYLFWHLKTLNASSSLLGVASAVQCLLGELPFFFFAGAIISKIGHFNTLTINFIAFGLRFIGYSYLTNPWYVLPIELLQGPSFGLFYTAMASYANIAALPGTEATMQGLIGGAFEGLGVAVGSLIGGIGMENYQGGITFFWAGIIAFTYAFVNVIFTIILWCKSKLDQKHQAMIVPADANAITERSSFI